MDNKYTQLKELLSSPLSKEEILQKVVEDEELSQNRILMRDKLESITQKVITGVLRGDFDDIINDPQEILKRASK